MTFVPRTFPPRDNEPSSFYPTALVPFTPPLKNKDFSDHSGLQMREGSVTHNNNNKKYINGWILEADESFIDFNYVPIRHINKGAPRSFPWQRLPALSTPTACGGQVFKYFIMLLRKSQTCRTDDPHMKHSQACGHLKITCISCYCSYIGDIFSCYVCGLILLARPLQ